MGEKPEQPDPEDILRAILHIDPKEAAEVRENADTKAKPDAAKDRGKRQ